MLTNYKGAYLGKRTISTHRRGEQSKRLSPHPAFLGRGGGNCPPPLPRRASFPVNGALRTALFSACCRLAIGPHATRGDANVGHKCSNRGRLRREILLSAPSGHLGFMASFSVHAAACSPLFLFYHRGVTYRTTVLCSFTVQARAAQSLASGT